MRKFLILAGLGFVVFAGIFPLPATKFLTNVLGTFGNGTLAVAGGVLYAKEAVGIMMAVVVIYLALCLIIMAMKKATRTAFGRKPKKESGGSGSH